MKINRFIGGLAGLVLAACGQENNTNNNNSNGNSDLDGGYSDSGYNNDGGKDVDGGDVKADGGQGNLPPVVIIEAKDDAGNVKNTFNVGEQVTYDLNKSYDPDCEQHNSCGQSKGMRRCERNDSGVGSGYIYFPPSGIGTFDIIYGSNFSGRNITLTAKCYSRDTGDVSTTNSITIKVN